LDLCRDAAPSNLLVNLRLIVALEVVNHRNQLAEQGLKKHSSAAGLRAGNVVSTSFVGCNKCTRCHMWCTLWVQFSESNLTALSCVGSKAVGCQKAVPTPAAIVARSHVAVLFVLKRHTEIGDRDPYVQRPNVQRRGRHRLAHCRQAPTPEMLNGLTTVLLALLEDVQLVLVQHHVCSLLAKIALRVQLLLVAWLLGPKWQQRCLPCW